DEAAKRDPARRLEAARQLGDAQDVGERSLAGGAQDERGMGAGRREQRRHGLLDGTVIAPSMQLAQESEAIHHGRQVRGKRLARSELAYAERMHAPAPLAVLEKSLAPDRE